jgi:hypothetical protein
MGDIDWYATERAAVSRADDLLQRGEPKQAAWVLQQTWPRLHEAVPRPGGVDVIADGVRLMALAAVRSDGDVRSELGWSSWSAAERVANVSWGIRQLRLLVVAQPLNNEMATALGEALARDEKTRPEALAILERLDATNAITSPEGYAALSLVRATSGDDSGAVVASAQCGIRASNDVIQCDTNGGRVTPAVTAAR